MKLIINTTKQNGNVKIQNCNLGYVNKRAVILKKKEKIAILLIALFTFRNWPKVLINLNRSTYYLNDTTRFDVSIKGLPLLSCIVFR
jgi:hypothetical protein